MPSLRHVTLVAAWIFVLSSIALAGKFKVNSTSFGMNCDQELSLDEAAFLAGGGLPFPRPLTNGEKASIEGGATFALAPLPPPCDVGAAGWILVGNAGLNISDEIIFYERLDRRAGRWRGLGEERPPERDEAQRYARDS